MFNTLNIFFKGSYFISDLFYTYLKQAQEESSTSKERDYEALKSDWEKIRKDFII